LVVQKTSKDENEEEIKPNVMNEWDRIVFPLMKRGGHFGFNLCTKKGTFERRFVARSNGEEYREGKKLKWGDLWRFGKRIANKFRK
jgi:ribosomal protein RSM22 (predicted rRNA methylase)